MCSTFEKQKYIISCFFAGKRQKVRVNSAQKEEKAAKTITRAGKDFLISYHYLMILPSDI